MCTTDRAAVPQCRCVSRGPAISWIDHAMRQHHKLHALRIRGRAMASPNPMPPMPPVAKSTLTGSLRDGRSRLTVAVEVWTVSAESVIPQTGGRRFVRANHWHGSLHCFDNSAIGRRQANARHSARWPAMASQRPHRSLLDHNGTPDRTASRGEDQIFQKHLYAQIPRSWQIANRGPTIETTKFGASATREEP